MKETLKIIVFSGLATAALLKGMPAFAADEQQRIASIVVKTSDLDLGSADGRHALDRRLVRAVADVCGSASVADLHGGNTVRQCRMEVLSKARARSAVLTATAAISRGLLVAAR